MISVEELFLESEDKEASVFARPRKNGIDDGELERPVGQSGCCNEEGETVKLGSDPGWGEGESAKAGCKG